MPRGLTDGVSVDEVTDETTLQMCTTNDGDEELEFSVEYDCDDGRTLWAFGREVADR